MNVVIDEKLIKRNAKIGQVVTIASLATLGAGMFLTFQKPDMLPVSIGALLVGFLLSQVGIYFTNRWGRSPRPDEQISLALKGLDKRYTLYHYQTPASHVLVGPAGVWVLIPKHQRGTITYSKNRWRQSGGGFIQNYLKIFAQEGIGRPDLEIDSDIEGLEKLLRKNITDGTKIPETQAALIFSDPNIDIQTDEAPTPTLPAKKLKDLIRKTAKEKPISPELVAKIQGAINPLDEIVLE
ncbi:hypothetical protein ACFLXI_06045 [Chloroflexota bacterium]